MGVWFVNKRFIPLGEEWRFEFSPWVSEREERSLCSPSSQTGTSWQRNKLLIIDFSCGPMDCFAMETLPPNYKFKSALRPRAAKLAVKFPLTVSKSRFSFLRGPFTAFQLPIYPTETIKLDTKTSLWTLSHVQRCFIWKFLCNFQHQFCLQISKRAPWRSI